jgi:glycerol-3-phosphate acyltransferase PlsY
VPSGVTDYGSSPLITALLWVLLAFICGSLPLSVWLGRLALGVDIRRFGDGNPGAANVWRAGGKWWGLLAILLDGFKGLIPVALARYVGHVEGWSLVAVALAPVAGHAFSPFLRFRGGKALSTTFGIWCALTLWVVPAVLGLALAFWLLLLRSEAWAVLAGLITLLVFLLAANAAPELLAVWAGCAALLLWKHRADFGRPPQWSKGILGKWMK